jgi:hypothetical protein
MQITNSSAMPSKMPHVVYQLKIAWFQRDLCQDRIIMSGWLATGPSTIPILGGPTIGINRKGEIYGSQEKDSGQIAAD